jgi:WD40 repeat protein
MKINKPTHAWQLSFDGDWPTSVAFLGNSHKLAAGNRQGQIYVWDLPATPPADAAGGEGNEKKSETPPDFAPSRRLDGHTNGITALIATVDGGTLISASLDGDVRLWDAEAKPSGTEEVVLDTKRREIRARRKSKAEKEKIVGAPGVQVELVGSSHVLAGHGDWVKAQGLSGDGRRLISGDDACCTIVWDLSSRKEISRWHGYERVWVSAAALSPDGKTAFTAEFAGSRSSFDRPAAQARLWNADNGTMTLDLLKVWTPKVKDKDRVDSYGYARTWGKLMKRGLVCAAFSPDGKLLAAGQGGETDTGKVHLIDVDTGKIVRTVSGHRYGVCDVKFSADGKYILSSGRDTTIRICQVDDGKEVAALGKARGGQFKDWMHSIAISPDQEWVATADIAGMVHLWQL